MLSPSFCRLMIFHTRTLITGNIIAFFLFAGISATMLYYMHRALHAEMVVISFCSSGFAYMAFCRAGAEIRRLRRWERDLQNALEPTNPPRPRMEPSYFGQH